MKNKTLRMLILTQIAIVMALLFLTLGNEFLDIPHYMFNDAPTLYAQRMGEICIELFIFFIVTIVQLVVFRKLYKRIRLLEGFIPICASCKKIRNQEDQWEQIEKYITEHSLARFSHGICPDCTRKLYPDFYNSKITGKQK